MHTVRRWWSTGNDLLPESKKIVQFLLFEVAVRRIFRWKNTLIGTFHNFDWLITCICLPGTGSFFVQLYAVITSLQSSIHWFISKFVTLPNHLFLIFLLFFFFLFVWPFVRLAHLLTISIIIIRIYILYIYKYYFCFYEETCCAWPKHYFILKSWWVFLLIFAIL